MEFHHWCCKRLTKLFDLLLLSVAWYGPIRFDSGPFSIQFPMLIILPLSHRFTLFKVFGDLKNIWKTILYLICETTLSSYNMNISSRICNSNEIKRQNEDLAIRKNLKFCVEVSIISLQSYMLCYQMLSEMVTVSFPVS